MDTKDVSQLAKLLGFQVPVKITELAWEVAVAWDGEDSDRQIVQNPRKRLHTLLWAAAWSIRSRGNAMTVEFDLYRVPRDGVSREPERMTLCATLTINPREVVLHLPEESPPLVGSDFGQTLVAATGIPCAA